MADDMRLTWGEYAQLIDKVAAGFLDLGIKRDDMVAVYLSSCAQAVVSHMALTKIGAISVLVPDTSRQSELEYMLEHTECKAVILPTELRGVDCLQVLEELLCP